MSINLFCDRLCGIAATVALVCSSFLQPLDAFDNWPQWRGANLDNTSSETGLPVKFGRDKNMLWRFELPGPAGASPIVWNDTAYVTSIDDNDGIWLIAVTNGGNEAWRRQLQGTNKNARDGGNSASPSPCTDGTYIWVTSTAGFLECFDMQGNPVWSVDLQERYGDFKIQFGMTSTPILDNGRLYLQMIHGDMRNRAAMSVGTIVALDAASGDEIWKHTRRTEASMENKHSYASPILVRDNDASYLVTHGGDYAIGHSLDDGGELWRCGGLNPRENYNPFLRFVSSPAYSDGMLIVPSAKNGPVLALNTDLSGDVTGDDTAHIWTMAKGTPDVATPVVVNGLVFLARENGSMVCVDRKTGEQVYEERLFAGRHRSTPVVADGKLYLAGRDGTILVLSADREPAVLAENDLGEETLASPAIANGKIYIRTFDALYCFGK